MHTKKALPLMISSNAKYIYWIFANYLIIKSFTGGGEDSEQ